MNRIIFLLTTGFCLLATACGPECNQGWGDSNRSHRVEIHYSTNCSVSGDPDTTGATKVLEALCEETPDYEDTDTISNCSYEKMNIGDDFELCLSTSKDFSFNLLENSFFSNGCANIHEQTGSFEMNLEVNVPIYSYVKFSDGKRG